jgi:hypothetical protein
MVATRPRMRGTWLAPVDLRTNLAQLGQQAAPRPRPQQHRWRRYQHVPSNDPRSMARPLVTPYARRCSCRGWFNLTGPDSVDLVTVAFHHGYSQ